MRGIHFFWTVILIILFMVMLATGCKKPEPVYCWTCTTYENQAPQHRSNRCGYTEDEIKQFERPGTAVTSGNVTQYDNQTICKKNNQ